MKHPGRRFALWMLLCLAALVLLVSLRRRPLVEPELEPDPRGERVATPEPDAVAGRSAPGSGGEQATLAAADQDDDRAAARCAPYHGTRCHLGDVYAIDSCGAPHDKLEECGASLCRGAACEPQQPEACAALPLEGRCEGDVVVGCIGGRPFERDCAALGKRCVVGDEGAQCAAATESACDPASHVPRCRGQTLVFCSDGQLERRDCAAVGAVCGALHDRLPASCYRVETRDTPPDPGDRCGACGCSEEAGTGDEVCDGRDNDDDESIDEGAQCDPLPIVAFVVSDAAGNGSYDGADLEREIERVNRVLSSDDGGGIQVELADVIELRAPQWLTLDSREFDRLLRGPELRLPRDEFFVPVVFTDIVISGDAPKAGISTLPNGRCGGRYVSDDAHAAGGAVAVAKGRAPTTVAHELGHFLGLCHTHYKYVDTMQRVVRWHSAAGELSEEHCDPMCVLDGDGICDTPPDPGPPSCRYDDQCQVTCEQAASPDPFNAMSYYTACRYVMSPLQLQEMRRNLHLRRGWYECRDGGCDCDPQGAACPAEMSCRPSGADAAAWTCELDGPREPGEVCQGNAQCGASSLCIDAGGAAARCMRVCTADATDCQCVGLSELGIGVCREQ